MRTISIIIPCYNEAENIKLFYEAVREIKLDANIEFWFIDDGSEDGTLYEMIKLGQSHPEVHYVSFSRNFGKEAALIAGLEYAKGDYIAPMDVDLQDPPSLLPVMLDKLDKNSELDCILTKRNSREGEPAIRSFFSKMFYQIESKLSDVPMESGVRDYRLMTRRMVDAILELREYNRFSKGLWSWVGFKSETIGYNNIDRVAGKTSWNFRSLFRYALEGIINFSNVPLEIATLSGIVICLLSGIAMLYIVIRALFWGNATSGWPSLATIILFMGGLQLFCLGIIGKYIGKIFLETKERPHYIVSKSSEDKINK